MYLLDDSEAYLAGQLAGLTDFAVGLLALTVGVSLLRSIAAPVQVAEEPSSAPAAEDSSPEEAVAEPALPEDASAE